MFFISNFCCYFRWRRIWRTRCTLPSRGDARCWRISTTPKESAKHQHPSLSPSSFLPSDLLPPPALIPLCAHTVLLLSACSSASAPCPCFLLLLLLLTPITLQGHWTARVSPPQPSSFGSSPHVFGFRASLSMWIHLLEHFTSDCGGEIKRSGHSSTSTGSFFFLSVLLEHYHTATSMSTCKAVIAEILLFFTGAQRVHTKKYNFKKEKILLLTRGLWSGMHFGF